MFGLPSPSKLLVLVVVILVVWHGFKWIGRAQNKRSHSPPKGAGIDTVACPKCGTYYDQSKGDLCGGDRCATTG